jgi:hypothetical protein
VSWSRRVYGFSVHLCVAVCASSFMRALSDVLRACSAIRRKLVGFSIRRSSPCRKRLHGAGVDSGNLAVSIEQVVSLGTGMKPRVWHSDGLTRHARRKALVFLRSLSIHPTQNGTEPSGYWELAFDYRRWGRKFGTAEMLYSQEGCSPDVEPSFFFV